LFAEGNPHLLSAATGQRALSSLVLTVRMKLSHADELTTSTTSSTSFESRTPITPPASATSTQLSPGLPLRLDFRHLVKN
jgi:hypothetical protein